MRIHWMALTFPYINEYIVNLSCRVLVKCVAFISNTLLAVVPGIIVLSCESRVT